MIAKCTSLLTFLILCLVSCTQEIKPDGVVNESQTKPIVISLSATKSFANESSTDVNEIDVISFARKNNEATYTYETSLYGLSPTTTEDGEQIVLTLEGSLPRTLYLIANADSRVIMPTLSSTTTAEEFENATRIQEAKIPEMPYAMAVKKVLDEPAIENAIEAELSRTLAWLDIENGYSGFTVDSLVLQKAKGGTYLFNGNLPTDNKNINYGNTTQMFIYPVAEANLAVYGKNNGVRMAFDIPLNQIIKGTRYKVSFRGAGDVPEAPNGKLQWKVALWSTGNIIASTPDWGKN